MHEKMNNNLKKRYAAYQKTTFAHCISDAEELTQLNNMKSEDIVRIASELFDKRCTHFHYWKQNQPYNDRNGDSK